MKHKRPTQPHVPRAWCLSSYDLIHRYSMAKLQYTSIPPFRAIFPSYTPPKRNTQTIHEMSQFQIPLLSILSLLASTVAVVLIDLQNLCLYTHPKFYLDALHSILWTFLVLVALAGIWVYYVALKMRRGGKVARSSVGFGVVVFVVVAVVIQMVLWEVKWVRQLRWEISMGGADIGMVRIGSRGRGETLIQVEGSCRSVLQRKCKDCGWKDWAV